MRHLPGKGLFIALMFIAGSFAILFLQLSTATVAQAQSNSADILGTKAYLESLLVQRFSNELSTQVDQSQFELSAQIDVIKVKPTEDKKSDDYTYTDLDLGFLDPEKLLTKTQENELQHFLASYRIRKVLIQAGLSPDLTDEDKAVVEKWLGERVKQEFGNSGSSQVQYIRVPASKTQPPVVKGPMDMLKDMQDLAGQLVMALALVIAAVLFGLFGRPKSAPSSEPSASVNVNNTFEGEGAGMGGGAGSATLGGNMQTETIANESLKKQIEDLSQQIIDIAPKVTGELDKVVKEWCRAGETGYEQVACLAQVVGETIGKVPVPEDFRQDVTDVFANMYKMDMDKKLDRLTRVYWDLMAVLNLGTEALHRPFSFLGSASNVMTQQVLLENSPQVQAVATYYMPKKQRKAYFGGLSNDQKMQLLMEASSLQKLPYSEVEGIEGTVAPMFSDDTEEKIVVLSKTLAGLVEVMSYRDGIVMLKDLSGPVLEEYKRTQPSLAFLHEWPEEPLSLFIQQSGQDELMALMATRPDLKDTIMNVLPPRMRQILEDDIGNLDNMKESEQEQYLQNLHMQLVLFVDQGHVELASAFNTELKAVTDEPAA